MKDSLPIPSAKFRVGVEYRKNAFCNHSAKLIVHISPEGTIREAADIQCWLWKIGKNFEAAFSTNDFLATTISGATGNFVAADHAWYPEGFLFIYQWHIGRKDWLDKTALPITDDEEARVRAFFMEQGIPVLDCGF